MLEDHARPANATMHHTAAMLRYVVHDIRLSNGFILPAGGLVMLEDDGVMDPLINPSPETFDAHRYLRMRSQPNEESRHQFATTSTDNLVFGYGVHQCPGTQQPLKSLSFPS